MLCTIWYYLYNSKSVENTHGGVLLSVKLKVLAIRLYSLPDISRVKLH